MYKDWYVNFCGNRFAGFIALAVAINGMVCVGIHECPIPAARAATAFGAFEWYVKNVFD